MYRPIASLGFVGLLSLPLAVMAQDGAHDFDFAGGAWRTHITRVLDPFDAQSAKIDLDGMVNTRPIWGGRGRLEEVEVDGPKGHWEGMGIYLFNPKARQWNEYFINSKVGVLGAPFVGSFKDGRGELITPDTFNDRAILVRALWFDIKADSHTYEEDFSDDGGKSWKLSFIAKKTRIPASEFHAAQEMPHEFDFHNGNWKTHSTRLDKPLSGSTQWGKADGTVAVGRIWDGSANISEVRTDYPSGPVDFLALRWYNPTAKQWNLSFATAAGGELGTVMAGRFKDGRIDFYDQEPYDGKAVLVRFSAWEESKGHPYTEQAFSADGGKSWEINFKTTYDKS